MKRNMFAFETLRVKLDDSKLNPRKIVDVNFLTSHKSTVTSAKFDKENRVHPASLNFLTPEIY